MFQVSIPALYIVAYIYLYFFSNRHILQDSDIVKSSIAISTSIFVGVALGLMIGNLILGGELIFVRSVTLAGVGITLYSPQMFLSAIFFAPTLVLIIFRILYRTAQISRRVSKRISRVGFTLIFWSIINFMFSLITFALTSSELFNDIPFAIVAVETMRSLFLILAMILGYLGWIMPEFFKKSIRGKAWIVNQMQKEFTSVSSPIASSDKTTNVAVEIAEK